jgi:hypothetical protein
MPLSPDQFRALALALPETAEGSHMDHPDFRVAGRTFASLHPKEPWGMVKLTPEQQARWLKAGPSAFAPVNGAWGRAGATYIILKAAKKTSARLALMEAWRNTAPKKLAEQFEA